MHVTSCFKWLIGVHSMPEDRAALLAEGIRFIEIYGSDWASVARDKLTQLRAAGEDTAYSRFWQLTIVMAEIQMPTAPN